MNDRSSVSHDQSSKSAEQLRNRMTHPDLDELAGGAAADFARRVALRWQDTLGADLLGAYLIGSLAHGGFSRRYSDLDIALVTAAGLSSQALDRMRSEAVAISADLGPKGSLFWADREFLRGRFPPLDRIDYLDHAIALIELEHVRPVRPRLDEVRDYLRGVPFSRWVERARSFAAAETLEPKDRTAFLRTLLYPARFCYSWITGLMGSNGDAAAFLSEGHVAGLDIGAIVRALECRQAAADPDPLFPLRTVLATQVDACVALCGGDVRSR